ncbi:MAG TPA: dihydrolipoamide acetyltransferase family protein [Ramlibacter sp.]|uniref:dihydrolipoamide acetyltransferase family protein n=1 Tax=Ramlibacter sp. TaxID=1917967 RepID=UPI002ED2AA62
MGSYSIRVPDIGEGIAEVELVAWRVQPGEMVKEDQSVADVMTDKATVEVPSPVSGTVMSLGGKVGQVLAVGSELIRLDVEGAGNLKETAVPPPPSGEGAIAIHKPLASPSVRHHARQLGIDLASIRGSGPGGRITHQDLETPPPSPARALQPREGEEAVPLTALRRRIAQKMQESKRRIPHFSYVEEIDVTSLEEVRAQLNARFGATRGKLTLLPFIARAVVIALDDFPQMNARFDDDAGIVTRYRPVHLGIATQTDAGLAVPVLHHAEAQDLWGLASEITRLAELTRSNKAKREDLTGSTLTLTSLGPLGGLVTTPVINHPEVAIVGVNRIVERPMFQGGAVAARKLMNLSSSFDHRVVDGMDAARFIQAVRALLEQPVLLLVEHAHEGT